MAKIVETRKENILILLLNMFGHDALLFQNKLQTISNYKLFTNLRLFAKIQDYEKHT